jgi:hypothetical protein
MSNNPLLEVRKAYRLLFDYQSRILDLMKFIGQSYSMPFVKGDPKFSTRGQNKLDNWAWDWLYMYYYSFHFNNSNDLYMSIYLLNDSGYFDASFDDNSISRLDVQKFKATENSTTKLIFVAAYKRWDWWQSVEPNSERFIKEESGVIPERNMVWKSYVLEKFFEEEDTLINLSDFESYCNSNGIPLNLKNKNI